jgi:hypothetical protein
MAAEKSSKWWFVYAAVVIVGGPYAVFFTRWGPRAYEAVCFLLLIYGLGAAVYTLLRPLFRCLRLNRSDRVPERQISEIEVQPAPKMPLFHDDPSRFGKSGIGMPALINFGVKKTIFLIIFFTGAGCLVHYFSAVPSRGETLLGIGFLSAIAFYLWLLSRFAKSVYRWLKRHTARSQVTQIQGR